MIDRESVVQALKDSLRNQHCGFIECVGNVYAVSEETINDTLELLKDQKAEYVEIADGDHGKTHWYACGGCKSPINPGDRYCHECGRALKWE